MTLVEMLVATVITLMLMGAVVTIFGLINDAIIYSRATVDMTDRLRAARDRIQQDLDHVTATTLPPLRPEAGLGYFEYVEGSSTDNTFLEQVDIGTPDARTMLGDTDDVLAFTVRSHGAPFLARLMDGRLIESLEAEVIYFVDPPMNPSVARGGHLYRQVRLIKPELNQSAYANTRQPSLSQRREYIPGSTEIRWTFNTLGDLTKRENRHAHLTPLRRGSGRLPFEFPYVLDFDPTLPPDASRPPPLLTTYEKDPNDPRDFTDLLLTGVLAFDVQAYDPAAPILQDPGTSAPVLPSDPNYRQLAAQRQPAVVVGRGGFVDLFYLRGVSNPNSAITFSEFAGPPNVRSGLHPTAAGSAYRVLGQSAAAEAPAVFDTWSWHYEQDGVDTDRDGVVDQAINGVDDPPRIAGIVHDPAPDDEGERETMAPYPVPLRGVKVTLRVIEPDTLEVRQVAVHAAFLPD